MAVNRPVSAEERERREMEMEDRRGALRVMEEQNDRWGEALGLARSRKALERARAAADQELRRHVAQQRVLDRKEVQRVAAEDKQRRQVARHFRHVLRALVQRVKD